MNLAIKRKLNPTAASVAVPFAQDIEKAPKQKRLVTLLTLANRRKISADFKSVTDKLFAANPQVKNIDLVCSRVNHETKEYVVVMIVAKGMITDAIPQDQQSKGVIPHAYEIGPEKENLSLTWLDTNKAGNTDKTWNIANSKGLDLVRSQIRR